MDVLPTKDRCAKGRAPTVCEDFRVAAYCGKQVTSAMRIARCNIAGAEAAQDASPSRRFRYSRCPKENTKT
jgi:hypothetical protein